MISGPPVFSLNTSNRRLSSMATSTAAAAAPRHSCAKLSVAVEDPKAGGGGAVFVKATWHPTRFSLAVTDGAGAWVAQASDAEVRLRAEQWDQPVADYLSLTERYLAFQQPSSTYSFHDAGNGNRRLSWTFEKQGTKLEWRWKLQPAPNTQQTMAEILDFLMDANIRLSEEVVRKTQSFDKLKQESDKCLQQSERFNIEKAEFEQATFSKFGGPNKCLHFGIHAAKHFLLLTTTSAPPLPSDVGKKRRSRAEQEGEKWRRNGSINRDDENFLEETLLQERRHGKLQMVRQRWNC